MESLINSLLAAIDSLKSSKGAELAEAFRVIFGVMNTNLLIPHSLLKVILIRCCAIAKSKDVTADALEIMKKIMDNALWVFEDNEEGKMSCTILLSALVVNIERDDAKIRRISWGILEKCIESLSSEILRACFPGVLRIVIEEIKRYRCQGLGTSKLGFGCALKCYNLLLDQISDGGEDPWMEMARAKTIPVVTLITADLVEIHKLRYEMDKVITVECLEKGYLLGISGRNEILGDIIGLCADTDRKMKIEIPYEYLKELFLKEITGLVELVDAEQKLRELRTAMMCLQLLGEDAISLLSLYNKTITDTLFRLMEFSKFEYSEFKFSEIIAFTGKDTQCSMAFICFINSIVKYEIFDTILSEQQKLLRRIQKDPQTEDLRKLLAISYLFSDVYIEASMHILTEIIFINFSDPHLQIISKLLFLYITQRLFEQNGLTTVECIENILYVKCKDTESECEQLFDILCKANNQASVKELLITNTLAIKKSLIFKLKIFGPENLCSGISSLINLAFSIDLINEIIKDSLNIYDSKSSSFTPNQVLNNLKYFSMLINQFIQGLSCKNLKLDFANPIRNILMRIKPMLSLKPSLLENRKIIMQCLQLYRDSIDLISNIPLEINPLDHSAFSFEEDPNVSIPDALAEISYEYFPAFIYCLKSMADSNCMGITTALIDIFQRIAFYNSDFFETDRRFTVKIFPYLKIVLRSTNFSTSFHIKLKLKILEFIKSLPSPTLAPVSADLLYCCKIIHESSPDAELSSTSLSLLHLLSP